MGVKPGKYRNLVNYSHIYAAIRHHGFCASLEVSNGRIRRRKKSQIDSARMFLTDLLKKENIPMLHGFAAVRSTRQLKGPHDFCINIGNIDEVVMREAAIDAVDSPYLSLAGRQCMNTILGSAELKGTPMLVELYNSDNEAAGHVKGFLLELYVKKLFDKALESVWRKIFMRVDYGNHRKYLGDLDVLVACSSENFNYALHRIRDRFGVDFQVCSALAKTLIVSSSLPYQK